MGWLFKSKKKRIAGGPNGVADYKEVLLKPVDYQEYESGKVFKNIEIASMNLSKYSGNMLNQTIVKGYEKLPYFVHKMGSEHEKQIFDKCYGNIDVYNLFLTFLLNSMVMNRVKGELNRSSVEWPANLVISNVVKDLRSNSEHDIIENYIEPLMTECTRFRSMFTGLGYQIEVYKE